MIGHGGNIDAVIDAAKACKQAVDAEEAARKLHVERLSECPEASIPCGKLDYAGRIRAGYDELHRGKPDEAVWKQWAKDTVESFNVWRQRQEETLAALERFKQAKIKFLSDVLGSDHLYFTDQWIKCLI